MAAQVITSVTDAAPAPTAITLASAITTAHISGNFGNNGAIVLESSDDGTAPYAPVGAASDIGAVGAAAITIGLVLPAGWRLRARQIRQGGSAFSVRVAVE
jgi:hypothetical protein